MCSSDLEGGEDDDANDDNGNGGARSDNSDDDDNGGNGGGPDRGGAQEPKEKDSVEDDMTLQFYIKKNKKAGGETRKRKAEDVPLSSGDEQEFSLLNLDKMDFRQNKLPEIPLLEQAEFFEQNSQSWLKCTIHDEMTRGNNADEEGLEWMTGEQVSPQTYMEYFEATYKNRGTKAQGNNPPEKQPDG